METIRGQQISSKKGLPSSSGEVFPFFNALHTQGPGVVHIWYNIPLCTIFSQKSNGDTFRTHLPDSKSSPKSITNFEEGPLAIQSDNSLVATRRPFEDPNHLALQRLGCHFLIRTILREILRVYQYFQSF
ncbi:hypothetical protein O181_039057 [Austropuccinia psidii MF-1]|uniref:Uncharacterized protein n=1 Tax=Austropuccinia psidii MF-1 TaxID=1389203 RepID=A0A9Q3DC46_9BASI|nr:hypothetical protein [Austropuccinia psidii MF-1]